MSATTVSNLSRLPPPRAPWRCYGVLALLWLVAGWLPALAQPPAPTMHYGHTRFDMRDGLPHNMVHSIAQDRQGFIWLATWEGVVRFNGRSFTVFDNENTDSARLSGAFALLAEEDGSILVGTALDGIYRYRNGHWTQYGHPSTHSMRVEDMRRTRDGRLWFSARNQLYWLDEQGRAQPMAFPAQVAPGQIHALYQDADGLLVASANGAWRVDQGQARPWGQQHGFADRQVKSISSDRQGGWVVVRDDGLWHWQGDGQLTHRLPGSRISQALVDNHLALWVISTNGQLVRLDQNGSEQVLQLDGLPSRALLVDREGLLWLGNSLGLLRLAPGAVKALGREDGLTDSYVRTVIQTADDTVWIGHAGGLQRWRDGFLQPPLKMPLPQLSGTVTALAIDPHGDGVWAGSYEQGVMRFDGAGQLLEHLPVAAGDARPPMVRALLPDAGGLLVGTQSGLLRLVQGRIETLGQQLGLDQYAVEVLSRDPQGRIWIGMEAGMAVLWPDGRVQQWRQGEDMPAHSVFDFLHDADGTLWAASDAGLLRLQGESMRVYDHHDGLPRDKLFRIIDDGLGRLWLSSNHGVFRVARSEFDAHERDADDLLAVDVVDSSDGMPSSQINGASWPAGWHNRNGQLMFPTGMGMVMIDPELVGRDLVDLPSLVFEQVVVNGERQELQPAYRLTKPTNRLSINYIALAFASPHKLRYRYRLIGFEQEWVEVDAGIEAVYTNLPPGDYRFQVQAMAMPMDWNDGGRVVTAELAVQQVPGFWQRPWVIACAGLLLLLIPVAWLLLRTRSYQRQQRRLNALVSQRTEELNSKNLALEAAGRERDDLLLQLEHQALYDSLTALPNRRAADGYLQQAVASAREQGTPLCVALIDVDNFKAINDRHGHQAGDQVLAHLGRLLAEPDQGAVFAARQGGEEFLLVMANTELPMARQRVKALCAQVADSRLEGIPGVTVSIGLAAYGEQAGQVNELLSAADANLYRAKAAGRNQVVG